MLGARGGWLVVTPRVRAAGGAAPGRDPGRASGRPADDGPQTGAWWLCRVTGSCGEVLWCHARWLDAIQMWEVRVETGASVAVDATPGTTGKGVAGLMLTALTVAQLRALAARGAR